MVGSIRRDCLDRVIVLNERHLRRILREYISYYHVCRTHLSLTKILPNHAGSSCQRLETLLHSAVSAD